MNPYDPLLPGPATVATRSFLAEDSGRSRRFPIDVWYADTREPAPLVVFSHHSVPALSFQHSIDEEAQVRNAVGDPIGDALFASFRRFFLRCANGCNHFGVIHRRDDVAVAREVLAQIRCRPAIAAGAPPIASSPCGAMGMSFGGWSVLAAPETDARIGSIVAIVPAGSSQPRPGILPVSLSFDWSGRDVPVLYVAAENDTSTPLAGVTELHRRTPGERRFFALRDADHLHFMSGARELHERVLTMEFPPELAWIRDEMRPFTELTPEQDAHAFVASLALAHFDATLHGDQRARTFLDDEALSAFERCGIRALRLG